MGSMSSTQLSHANQTPVGVAPSNLIASSELSQKSQIQEFDFQTVHEAFGKEIEQDLKERRRLKELAKRPLIEF